MSQTTWVDFLRVLELWCPLAMLLGIEPFSGLTRVPVTVLLYCCGLYNFFFLNFFRDYLQLTGFQLFMWTSNFKVFGAPGVGPGVQDTATVIIGIV